MTGQYQLERRILASMIVEPVMLFAFDGVELADFIDYRHRVWFVAIRWLQANGREVSALAILDRIEATDLEFEKFDAENANGAWLAETIIQTTSYRVPSLAKHDAALLRASRDRRDAAMKAAA